MAALEADVGFMNAHAEDLPNANRSLHPDRRQLVLGGLLMATAAAAYALQPRRAALLVNRATFEDAIPLAIGAYRSVPSPFADPLPDEVSQQLYEHVLSRIYAAPALPTVMLMIAYGSAEDGTRAIHRPDDCYVAAGYSITKPALRPLSGSAMRNGRARSLGATLDGRIEQIYFWTRIGDHFPVTAREEHTAVLKDSLAGREPDGVLVRLSILSADPNFALRSLMAFNAQLLASLPPTGRRLLLGSAR